MSPPNVREGFAAAQRLHKSGQRAGALVLYQRILGDHPDHAPTLHMLGVLALQEGKHEMAAGRDSYSVGGIYYPEIDLTVNGVDSADAKATITVNDPHLTVTSDAIAVTDGETFTGTSPAGLTRKGAEG